MSNALSQVPRLKSFEVYDKMDPRSIYNMLPDCKLKRVMELVPDDLKNENERRLFEKIQPSENVQLLRHAFWAELRTAYDHERPINIESTHAGIMTKSAYVKNLTPHNVAFILCPTQEYFVKLEHAHDLALKGVVEILSTPRTGEKGYDYNYDRLKLEIFKFLNDKKHGAAVQKQLNINHNFDKKKPSNNKSIEDLERELRGNVVEVVDDND